MGERRVPPLENFEEDVSRLGVGQPVLAALSHVKGYVLVSDSNIRHFEKQDT